MSLTITAGDDWSIPVDLKVNGAPFNISGATLVRFGVVSGYDNTIVGSPITVTGSESGAAWTVGRVMCPVAAATTASITPGTYRLEIEVTLARKTTFLTADFVVRKQGLT